MTDSMGLKLRMLLSTTRREGPGRGYPRHLREKAVRYVLSRREQGATYGELADTLGVPTHTLQRWSRALGRDSSDATDGPFRRVQIAAETARGPTLYGPCGLRIEGLDLETLAALLRRLAS